MEEVVIVDLIKTVAVDLFLEGNEFVTAHGTIVEMIDDVLSVECGLYELSSVYGEGGCFAIGPFFRKGSDCQMLVRYSS